MDLTPIILPLLEGKSSEMSVEISFFGNEGRVLPPELQVMVMDPRVGLSHFEPTAAVKALASLEQVNPFCKELIGRLGLWPILAQRLGLEVKLDMQLSLVKEVVRDFFQMKGYPSEFLRYVSAAGNNDPSWFRDLPTFDIRHTDHFKEKPYSLEEGSLSIPHPITGKEVRIRPDEMPEQAVRGVDPLRRPFLAVKVQDELGADLVWLLQQKCQPGNPQNLQSHGATVSLVSQDGEALASSETSNPYFPLVRRFKAVLDGETTVWNDIALSIAR